jgi:hypothetical protein
MWNPGVSSLCRANRLRRDVMRGWNFSSNADWMVALLLVLTVAAAAFA